MIMRRHWRERPWRHHEPGPGNRPSPPWGPEWRLHRHEFPRWRKEWQRRRGFLFFRFAGVFGLIILLVLGGMAALAYLLTHLFGGDGQDQSGDREQGGGRGCESSSHRRLSGRVRFVPARFGPLRSERVNGLSRPHCVYLSQQSVSSSQSTPAKALSTASSRSLVTSSVLDDLERREKRRLVRRLW